MSIRIITDSASDLTSAEADALGVILMPLTVTFDNTSYLDGTELTHDDFFKMLIESDVLPTTSQLSPYNYETTFTPVIEAGDEILCITLSSKLSGCYQSACIAASEFEDSKDAISIVDSENACIGERILVERAVMLKNEGNSLSEITEIINEEKKTICLVALLDTLEYLKKGGRISATAAVAGTILNIKPVIAIENGEVALKGKARGSKNGNNILKEQTAKSGGINFKKPVALAYSGLSRVMLDKYLEDCSDLYSDFTGNIPVSSIGSTIGTHIGPGAIAAAFFTPAE